MIYRGSCFSRSYDLVPCSISSPPPPPPSVSSTGDSQEAWERKSHLLPRKGGRGVGEEPTARKPFLSSINQSILSVSNSKDDQTFGFNNGLSLYWTT
jgi:hypothetical protein